MSKRPPDKSRRPLLFAAGVEFLFAYYAVAVVVCGRVSRGSVEDAASRTIIGWVGSAAGA